MKMQWSTKLAVGVFAEKVKKEAGKYECKYLINWSDRVISQMRIFDIERLPDTFAEFPDIINQLKQSTEPVM
ncbi:MAG: hypothetical protein GY795_30495 [Desulfobacterales bacterium]|nr:hypothetical protein [Desulfobacterales bacterium]